MPLCKHRTLFLSSKDRISGDRRRFRLDMSGLLQDLEPASHKQDESRVDVSVSGVLLPFKHASYGKIRRLPNVLTANLEPPIVQLVNVHTSMPMSNVSSDGEGTIMVQFPFAPNYTNSVPEVPETKSYASYRQTSDNHAGRFTLLHGPKAAFSNVEFWCTDEKDRLLTPDDDWYLSLAVFCESCIDHDVKKDLRDMKDALDEVLEVERLMLYNADPKRRKRKRKRKS